MKYSITIHDLSAKQVTELLNRCNGDAEVMNVQGSNVLPLIAAQNNVAANSTADDIDEMFNASTNELLKSTNTGERDSAGMLWDERIHSGSKKKNADGKWKLRKNVDENLVKEIQGAPAATGVTIAPNHPPVKVTTQGGGHDDIPAFLRREPVGQTASAPAIAPATFVAPAMPPAAAPVMSAPLPAMNQPPKRDFSGLMLKISNLFASKQITADYPKTIVERVNAGFGVSLATVTDVANDPRMVEYSWQCLEVDGKAA